MDPYGGPHGSAWTHMGIWTYVGVRGYICCPWVRWGWGLDGLGKFFPRRLRRRRRRPPVLTYLFSPTCSRLPVLADLFSPTRSRLPVFTYHVL